MAVCGVLRVGAALMTSPWSVAVLLGAGAAILCSALAFIAALLL